MKFLNSRKFRLWLASFGCVLLVYLLYGKFSDTPEIGIAKPADFTKYNADSNSIGLDKNFGKVTDSLWIGEVQNNKFIHRKKDKSIDRIFGFEKLLHKNGEEWEIQKPYMNIYRGDFSCFITADIGQIQVDSSPGVDLSPEDATLEGNVKIHIKPTLESEFKESWIFLDRVDFLSENSKILSPGTIKFVSEDAWMEGKGLELVYNEQSSKLEYLRINRLDFLKLKQPASDSATANDSMESGGPSPVDTSEPVVYIENEQQGVTDVVAANTNVYYKAILKENVWIESVDNVIRAEQVILSNILFSDSSDKKTVAQADGSRNSAETGYSEVVPVETETKEISEVADSNSFMFENTVFDIVVRCGKGITITPMESLYDSVLEPAEDFANYKNFEDPNGRASFVARMIEYSFSDGLISMDENCYCTINRADPNFNTKYNLKSPSLTIKLADENQKNQKSPIDINYLKATGPVVQIGWSKWQGGQLFGFANLKCVSAEFENQSGLFTAYGPNGILAIDNSKGQDPNEAVEDFGLQRKCYAVLEGYEKFTYSFNSDSFEIQGKPMGLSINYFPVIDGAMSNHYFFNTGYLKGVVEDKDDQKELKQLIARDGILYQEENLKFEGDDLDYNVQTSTLTITGNQDQPCMVNGALVDAIEYNIKTGQASTIITAPSMLNLN